MDGVDFIVDLKTTADTFNSVHTNVTKFGQVITVCRSLFSSYFVNFKLEFTERQANMVAHALAREATLIGSPTIYLHTLDCIATLISNEIYKYLFLKNGKKLINSTPHPSKKKINSLTE